MKYFLYLLILLFTFSPFANASEKTIIMGYKAIAKPPLIGGHGDDSGLYLDLFKKAAERIGYELLVVRIPKKRLHFELARGTVDFYPGSSFSQKRTGYIFYLPNGLQTKEVLISLDYWPEINSMDEVEGRLIVELSSSKLEWDQIYPKLTISQMGKLSMEKVIEALKTGRGDFYVADIEIVDHYQKLNDLESYEEIGIKIHHNAINQAFIPMNMGFSRKSKLFSEYPNPSFSPDDDISIENFYTIVDQDSVAYQFYQALDQLKQEGYTQKLYDQYFKQAPNTD
ncbi:substrate-binding periplasmic protein [Neptuniibacter sp. PT8_73]|uniref:substrate-binding periplasmic protein n=1 Tax=unclassified Neptuniibacter TaxID=2630693 RepID=UPI0039F65A0D